MNGLNNYLVITNINLASAGLSPVTVQEFFVYLFLRLLICLDFHHGDLEFYWSTGAKNRFLHGKAFGAKYGMSRHRFEALEKALAFGNMNPNDRWWKIRELINDFNSRLLAFFTPGTRFCLDESVSMWYGKQGRFSEAGLPHVTKMKGKPRGTGLLMRTLADSETNILIRLELQESKQEMELKKYQFRSTMPAKLDPAYLQQLHSKNVFKYTTALSLRMTENYFGSGRTLCGDSLFGNVETAEELHRHGIYFTGMIKQGTKNYPKQILETWAEEELKKTPKPYGNKKVLKSTFSSNGEDADIIALGWLDSSPRYLVSTRGITLSPNTVERSIPTRLGEVHDVDIDEEENAFLEYPVPKLVEDYYEASNSIDVHNQLRQGILMIEEHWKTHRWDLRAFSTVFGIILANAFLAYRLDNPESKMHFQDFCYDLCDHYLPENQIAVPMEIVDQVINL